MGTRLGKAVGIVAEENHRLDLLDHFLYLIPPFETRPGQWQHRSGPPFILGKAGLGLNKNWLKNGGKPLQVWTNQLAAGARGPKFGHGT